MFLFIISDPSDGLRVLLLCSYELPTRYNMDIGCFVFCCQHYIVLRPCEGKNNVVHSKEALVKKNSGYNEKVG